MKTLKSILLGLALTIAFTAAKADGKPTKMDVLNIFMDAAAHGKTEKLEAVLDNDLEYEIQRGGNTIKTNKKTALDFFKAGQNVEQACKCSSTTLEDNGTFMVVKVEMKYDTYIRINVVTIKNTGSSWKITKVNTSVANA